MMHKRLTTEFARIEQNYPNSISEKEIYELLNKQIILPGGSLLYGIGNNNAITSLGNCFVVESPADSYGGIFKTDEELAQLMKRRCGVGVDISTLRPKGTSVTNSAGTSTGAVSFLPRYSNTTREVAQESRRGALMVSMDINHPDVEDFIESKDDLTKITGANISVKVSDEFMQSIFPENLTEIQESYLWKKLVHQAWKSAEPGVLFWDKITSESPADCYEGFKTISTNPCVTEDTLILTNKGYFPIVDLVDTKIKVWNGKEFSETTPKITGINQQILKNIFIRW